MPQKCLGVKFGVFTHDGFLLPAGNVGAIEFLVSRGAEVDVTDVKAQTPLFVAVVNQHWESARALLEAGADPNGSDKNM